MGSPSDDDIDTIKEPLLVPSNQIQKGGFRTLPFIIANEAFEQVASYGLLPNMILNLTRNYGMEAAHGANVMFLWKASTYFTPILGAFLADSYVGRYPMIVSGSIVSLLGMVLLWLTAIFPQARPPSCGQFLSENCKSATGFQLLLLYSSFCLMSIGAGGIRSSSLAFGADQLRNNTDNYGNCQRALESYFSWYYVLVSASTIVAITCIVYIQDNMGWGVGFGVCVLLMLFSTLSFLLASNFYVKCQPKTSLFNGIAQVFVASYINRRVEISSNDDSNVMYHRGKQAMLLVPSETLSFFNKACIVRNPDEDLTASGKASDPWSLCTVDQVEELKALIKVIPIWSTGMFMAVTLSQGSFGVLQAVTLDRHITPNFEIPAGSLSTFFVLFLVMWVAMYDHVLVRLASKIKGKPVRLSLKQRMGAGILMSSASMASFAILESFRRETAIREGFSDNPNAVVNISAMWVLPHYFFGGVSEALNTIGQSEFYYTELSKNMSSIATALFQLGMSIGNLVASFTMKMVNDPSERAGNQSWVSSNINRSHYDYYFWLLAGLSLVNFVYYLACCKAYGPCKGETLSHHLGDNERMRDER